MTHCHIHMTKKTNTPHSRHKFIFTSEFVGSFFFHFVSLFVVFFFLFRLLSFWTSSQIQLRGPCFDIVDDCPLVKIRHTYYTHPASMYTPRRKRWEKRKRSRLSRPSTFASFPTQVDLRELWHFRPGFGSHVTCSFKRDQFKTERNDSDLRPLPDECGFTQ